MTCSLFIAKAQSKLIEINCQMKTREYSQMIFSFVAGFSSKNVLQMSSAK